MMKYSWLKEMALQMVGLFSYRNGRRFMILAQGRSGSTLITNLLSSHPQLVCEGEVLYKKYFSPKLFLNGKAFVANWRGKVWGFKVKNYQLTYHNGITNLHVFLEEMQRQGWKLIYLKRENVALQAISTLIGAEEQKWVYKKGDVVSKPRIKIASLEVFLRSRMDQLEIEKSALKGIEFLEVTYETDLMNQANHQATCDKIFDYLGIRRQQVNTDLMKSGSGSLEDIIQNHAEVRAELKRLNFQI